MCGIAGYIGPDCLPPARLQACLRLMRRRGPDHQACRHWRTRHGQHVYLLHSRLRIIDLDDRANQPMRLGRKWLIYNGELYNYLELRPLLAARGYRFTTHSDTEVFLAALDSWGWQEGLEHCEGMWAFALYDEDSETLTLGRDRFGEKPLYLLRHGGGLYFGSEVKFLQALCGHRLRPNLTHLYRYLVNGYKALYKTPQTFFHGVEALPSATLLHRTADGQETPQRYWQPAYRPDEALSYADAVAGVRERLLRTVELRLRADVPLAFCMSGGVDSNALISIAKRVFGYDVHGFTIVNTDARYDEQALVAHVVGELGLRHTAVPLQTADFLPRLRTLVRQHDAPVYTLAYYTHWLLMEQVAAAGYRIAVSGTGADELFSGYYDHHLAYLYEVHDEPALYAAARRAWEEQVRPWVRNPYLRNPDLFLEDPGFRDHLYFQAEAFAGYLVRPWHEPFQEQRFTSCLLRNRMLNELFYEAVPVILHEDDLNAMYFSLENRSPYLDRSLFDFCFCIPTRYLIRQGRAKAVLRDAVRGIVPQPVLDNPRKVGFNAPIHALLDVRDPAVRAALLDDSPIFEHVRRDRIAALLDKPYLPNSESKFLFSFLASKLFLEEVAA
ncbi:MAG: asparagine synthetase B [Candidatus Tectimicrobiota bacterium]|nr:MAG: asparagine synthetase B [Candidatus Tectomicrobia bacterium]